MQADSEGGRGLGYFKLILYIQNNQLVRHDTTGTHTAAHIAVRTPQTEVTTSKTSVSSQTALLEVKARNHLVETACEHD